MENKICQSCSMPLEKDVPLGTNIDGSTNSDYCIYCFENGEYTDDMKTVDEYTEAMIKYADEVGMTEEQMKEHCKNVLPTLKRWKNA